MMGEVDGVRVDQDGFGELSPGSENILVTEKPRVKRIR